MTTIINPRRINRTIVVERDSRTLTARVIDALDAPNGMADMLADAQQARDDAQAAQVIAETARDESVVAGNQAVQAAADASASEANAASSEGIAAAAASTAVSARDDAVAARNAAQTAQGLAETARTGADTARTGAESAQAAAGTHATNAQTFRNQAEAARDAAATSASNAATSEANADADAIATAADRVQTGLDAQATAADRVQTGLDRSAAASSASAAALSASMANGMPLGTIAHFAAAAPPDGWLVCDGTAVTALYPDLRAFLLDAGSPYGVYGADPLLPDLRGEFVRGFDGGRGVDAGRVFGSAQGDAIRNITGTFDPGGRVNGASEADFTGPFTRGTASRSSNGNASSDSRVITFDASKVVPTASENRPRNIALLPCIRAYATEDQSKILGVGQEWRNLIRARAAGEEYENTTGRTIQVNLTGKSSAAEGRVVETKQGAGAWVPVGYLPGSAAPVDGSASFVVPASARYRVNGSGSVRSWSELRTLIDPATLFANGEQGAWFDPSDLTSMYQDVAGTIPAAIGQPVGLILDKSGNGNHASQATTTARPTLAKVPGAGQPDIYYLEFDGVDDQLQAATTAPGACGPFYACLGFQGVNLGGSASGLAGITHHYDNVNYSGLGASLYGGQTGLARVYRRRRDPSDIVESLQNPGPGDLNSHVISGGVQSGKLFLGLDGARVAEINAAVFSTVPGRYRLGGPGLAQRIFGALWLARDQISEADMTEVESYLAVKIYQGIPA